MDAEQIEISRNNLSQEKQQTVAVIQEILKDSPGILTAEIYGSWLHSEASIDLDVAAIVPSEDGVVAPDIYVGLRALRGVLANRTKQDIDLIPHTQDEIDDFRSPLYNPRYNPSLIEGLNIKGSLGIIPSYERAEMFDFGDQAASVLYDNRTVCRRQLIRSFTPQEGRIFVSKLSHGPGNALTYYALKHRIPYLASPSDWFGALYHSDELYGLESDPALEFLRKCRNGADEEAAAKLMNWHEHLLAAVLRGGSSVQRYNTYCQGLDHD